MKLPGEIRTNSICGFVGRNEREEELGGLLGAVFVGGALVFFGGGTVVLLSTPTWESATVEPRTTKQIQNIREPLVISTFSSIPPNSNCLVFRARCQRVPIAAE